MFVGIDAELGDSLGVGRNGHEVLRHSGFVAKLDPPPSPCAEVALVSVSRVANVFEEMMKRVSSADRSRVASTKSVEVDVRDEAHRHVAPGVMAKRLVGHHRAEVGPADPDVDDVADGLAGVALPLARPHPFGEGAHRVEDVVHLLYDVRPVHYESCPRGMRSATCRTDRSSDTLMCSPRNMASRLAGKIRFLGQPDQEADRLVGDPVLRVIEIDTDGFGA